MNSLEKAIFLIAALIMVVGCRTDPFFAVQDFERGDFENWNTKRLVDDGYSAQIVTAPVRQGMYAARFEVRKGDFIRDGRRAELKDKFYAPIGSEVWYSLSTLLPEDIPIEDGHCVLTQWHETADNEIENKASRSPPLAHRFRSGRFYVSLRHSSEKTQTSNDGEEIILYEADDFPLGVWHDFVYHVKWSWKEDGFVKGWHNGKQVIDYTGPVGYNDENGIYLKLGMYRNGSQKTYISYHDNYRRASTKEAVLLEK